MEDIVEITSLVQCHILIGNILDHHPNDAPQYIGPVGYSGHEDMMLLYILAMMQDTPLVPRALHI